MCGSRKYPYPPRRVFSSLTPHPTGFSVPEGFALLPLPTGMSMIFSTWSPIPLFKLQLKQIAFNFPAGLGQSSHLPGHNFNSLFSSNLPWIMCLLWDAQKQILLVNKSFFSPKLTYSDTILVANLKTRCYSPTMFFPRQNNVKFKFGRYNQQTNSRQIQSSFCCYYPLFCHEMNF